MAEEKSKIMSVQEIVKRFIKPKRAWCVGGFGYTRTNVSIPREVIRQNIPDLYVQTNAGATPIMMMGGAGQLAWVEMTYLGLETIQPVSYEVRKGLEDGQIEAVMDHTNYSWALRTIAGKYGMQFVSGMTELGSDLLEYDTFGEAGLRGKDDNGLWIHPDIPPKRHAIIKDPFDAWGLRPHQYDPNNKYSLGDEPEPTMNQTAAEEDGIYYEALRKRVNKYTQEKGPIAILYPPAIPYVTTTHVQRVGDKGTARIEGLLVPDVEQSISAKYLVISAEKIVPEEELRLRPSENQIPFTHVDAILEAPFGCYPTGSTYYYDYDWMWWMFYIKANRAAGTNDGKKALAEYWHNIVGKDEWDFLENKVGTDYFKFGKIEAKYESPNGTKGFARLYELRADAKYGYKPDLYRPIGK
ncbi:CoA-transferase [Hippea maritima]|uniref:Coenzyme A transferase n=1 Tax=Hippea maritima (strain ATCC 700847 / DSM 10411 / MH2) TaxID=760142 RepID=F2LU41_HIPMA|nr:CoA-transferase [Hippea maritima]AEA34504.1 coenzyme A transferase [Hippea maritima DSM 10411]